MGYTLSWDIKESLTKDEMDRLAHEARRLYRHADVPRVAGRSNRFSGRIVLDSPETEVFTFTRTRSNYCKVGGSDWSAVYFAILVIAQALFPTKVAVEHYRYHFTLEHTAISLIEDYASSEVLDSVVLWHFHKGYLQFH